MDIFYTTTINSYKKDESLTSDDIITVGDVHGSILQAFYPLKRSGILSKVKILSDNILFEVGDFENSPTIVFLGDYFHRSFYHKSFSIVNALLSIKKIVGSKLELILGNHDVGQYVFERGLREFFPNENLIELRVLKKFLEKVPIAKGFALAAKDEHDCSKPEFITEFIQAVDDGIFKIAYVDKNLNLYSHTVANDAMMYVSDQYGSEIGFKKSIKISVNYPELPDNISVMYAMEDNFSTLLRTDYVSLINHINYLHDRPLTKTPIDKTKIMRTIIHHDLARRDISEPSSKHFVGHTPSFKRHPEDPTKVLEVLDEFVLMSKSLKSSKDEFPNKKEFISRIHEINSVETTVHDNVFCCDSQALFTADDFVEIMFVEKNYARQAILFKLYFNEIYEQPNFYIVSEEGVSSDFGEVVIHKEF